MPRCDNFKASIRYNTVKYRNYESRNNDQNAVMQVSIEKSRYNELSLNYYLQ